MTRIIEALRLRQRSGTTVGDVGLDNQNRFQVFDGTQQRVSARIGQTIPQGATAFTAGQTLVYPHSLGASEMLLQAKTVSGNEVVLIRMWNDASNVYVQPDGPVPASTLKFLLLPLD